MNDRKTLVVMGAGGFGPEVVWAAGQVNAVQPTFDIVGYCDDEGSKKGGAIDGLPILGRPEEAPVPAGGIHFVCAIGSNSVRAKIVPRLLALGWKPATVIDPSVMVAPGVTVGEGTYVGAGCILAPHAAVGRHVIVNHHCSIGHNSTLEDYVQVSPGGRVSGACVLKEGAYLGSNAVVAQGKSLGRYAKLGACSFAVSNIPDGATAIGIPARVMMKSA